MRPEQRWPGRDGDDEPRHGVPAVANGRFARADGGGPVIPPPTAAKPIDTDFEEIETPDGGVIIRFGGPELLERDNDAESYETDFYENLAENMDEGDLSSVAEELLEGIESDIQSRTVWMADYEKGISLLGIQLKQPRAEATGEGVSVVDYPLLLEATILYQSSASAEWLPAAGPVKIDNGGKSTAITDQDAQQLEKDMNIYVTVKRPEYVPDTERMIYQQGFAGMGFKKLFHCPLRRAPVSDAIAPGDFIVSNTATSLQNCGRKTHRIKMRPAVMKRMQYVGAYRDVDLATPAEDIHGIERKTAAVYGMKTSTTRQQDVDFTIYECCAEVDMPGDRHMENGKPTGLPRPYIVTIEKDSRQILEIRRNWIEEDDLFEERRRFVDFPFVPMFGFYASGLLHILGNTNTALTAGWRIMLDKGMFSNFPGGMYAKNGDRQLDNNFRAAPGEFVAVDISGFDDIRKVVAAYPYTEPGTASQAFFQSVADTGQRVGGAANIPVAEGKADTPVGTMLAALEQASKMISAVHRRGHTSQALEFQIWLELIREKPEDFVKFFKQDGFWTVDRLERALNNWSLIPRSNPNTPTQMHRLLKMMAIKQLQQLSPELYDVKKVDELILRTIGIDDPEELFAPPAPPGAIPPDPSLAIATIVAQTEQMKAQSKEKIEMGKGQLKAQTDLEKLQIEREKIDAQIMIAQQKEEAAMAREALKLEGQQMSQEHDATVGEADREHQAGEAERQREHDGTQADRDRKQQSSEGKATRDNAKQLAKMKPKPKPAGKK